MLHANRPYTKELTVYANQLAFRYFKEMHHEIIYNKDKVLSIYSLEQMHLFTDIIITNFKK